jgi:hypothetical protein
MKRCIGKTKGQITLANNPEVSAIYSPSIVYVSYRLTLDGHALRCFIDCDLHTRISANGKGTVINENVVYVSLPEVR